MRKKYIMREMRQYVQYAIVAVMYLLALYVALTMYGQGGANWDFIDHWLYAKSLVTPRFYSALFGGNLYNAIQYGDAFYFETLRAPLTGLLMAPFVWLGGNGAIPEYLAFALLLLASASVYASRKLDLPPSLLAMLLLTPYSALFLLLLNGTEIVSMSIMLISVSLLVERDWKAGIFMGLAAMAKYPNLIFVPLIFLLPSRQRGRAVLAFSLIILSWLAFNTIVFHDPIMSYLISIGAFSQGGTSGFFPPGTMAQSLWLVLPELAPAAAILAIAIVAAILRHGGNYGIVIAKLAKAIRLQGHKYGIVLYFLCLGLLGWLMTAARGSINDLPRLGYLIYGGLAMLLAMLAYDSTGGPAAGSATVRKLLFSALFVIMAAVSVTWFPYTNYVFYGSLNPVLLSAESAINGAGIGGCNIVSNNWVYLIFAGYRAHFPYYYNSTVQRYPIVFFPVFNSNNTAVNFANVTKRIEYNGFVIAFPKNRTC